MVSSIIGTAASPAAPFPRSIAAKRLGPGQRKDLSVQVLAHCEPVTRLSARHEVSRKFLYQQAGKADRALDEVSGQSYSEEDGHRLRPRPPLGHRLSRCQGTVHRLPRSSDVRWRLAAAACD